MTTPATSKLPEPATCEDCLTVVAYLRATKEGVPVWGEDCVCQSPVYPSDPDGSDADSISMPLVRLSDAQLLAAEVERLRAERDGLVDMYQRLAESMGYTSGKDGMEFSPEEWGAALKTDAERYRWLREQAEPNQGGERPWCTVRDRKGYAWTLGPVLDAAIDAALDASRLALKEEAK
ncbi:hypothetical protein J2W30_003234 [Variovorax boronicumulans]|uniref:hypothetical protein n=1 Tax=Variovorax boronicumulans TaxID=436515 RepID=UPI002786FC79|nr:hypothetical protein [Variovorax boronicumulans]MDQ0035466.1 hypothetical protein [Variovorax boronicumulans]